MSKINLKKRLLTLIHPIRNVYWFLTRPTTYGVKVVLKKENKLLMVRHAYGLKNWTFPGGKTNKGETNEETAKREIKEELGIDIENIVYLGEFVNKGEFKHDTIGVLLANPVQEEIKKDDLEIEEYKWIEDEEILINSSPVVNTVMNMYKKNESRKDK